MDHVLQEAVAYTGPDPAQQRAELDAAQATAEAAGSAVAEAEAAIVAAEAEAEVAVAAAEAEAEAARQEAAEQPSGINWLVVGLVAAIAFAIGGGLIWAYDDDRMRKAREGSKED